MKRLTVQKILSKANSLKKRRNSKTIYVPVDDNMYYDGTSYRVRVSINGTKFSKNFKSIKTALNYKNNLINLQ